MIKFMLWTSDRQMRLKKKTLTYISKVRSKTPNTVAEYLNVSYRRKIVSILKDGPHSHLDRILSKRSGRIIHIGENKRNSGIHFCVLF